MDNPDSLPNNPMHDPNPACSALSELSRHVPVRGSNPLSPHSPVSVCVAASAPCPFSWGDQGGPGPGLGFGWRGWERVKRRVRCFKIRSWVWSPMRWADVWEGPQRPLACIYSTVTAPWSHSGPWAGWSPLLLPYPPLLLLLLLLLLQSQLVLVLLLVKHRKDQ